MKTYNNQIFISSTYYYPDKKCYTLKLFHGHFVNQLIHDVKLFCESSPECIANSPSIAGELGGKIIILNEKELIIAAGSGVDTLANENWSSYGKTILISHKNGHLPNQKTFTKGHRNPSGLFSDGVNIYEVEHGPSGGDELNKLVQGKNYGWPNETYGYESHEVTTYMPPKKEFSHEQYEPPLFA